MVSDSIISLKLQLSQPYSWLTLRIEILGAFFSAGLATYLVYGGGSAASAAKIGFLLSMAGKWKADNFFPAQRLTFIHADSFNYMILHWINCVNEFEISSEHCHRCDFYYKFLTIFRQQVRSQGRLITNKRSNRDQIQFRAYQAVCHY